MRRVVKERAPDMTEERAKGMEEQARDQWLRVDGPRALGFVLGTKRVRTLLHRRGIVDLTIPADATEPPYFYTAMEYLQRIEGYRATKRWSLVTFAHQGKKTYRVTWLDWLARAKVAQATLTVSRETAEPPHASKHRPRFAPHVVGFIPKERFDNGGIEPAIVHMLCEVCGARHQVNCATGAYRQWVDKFATVHLHRDTFKDPIPRRQ